MALRVRGETVDEITGAVTAMREKMLRVAAPAGAIDVVGTGGDASGSYNILTCAALIVAGAGVPVAKHGNRALSSRSGAADVLGALGVKIDLTPEAVGRCIAEAGIGFMFAPAHHPAMKHVGPTRVELGTRTTPPRSPPSNSTSAPGGRRVLAVMVELAEVLRNLGSKALRCTARWPRRNHDGGADAVAALENGVVRSLRSRPRRRPPAREAGGPARATLTENAQALDAPGQARRSTAMSRN
jgi:anthranilate phosphoribosyltransferase